MQLDSKIQLEKVKNWKVLATKEEIRNHYIQDGPEVT